MANTGETKEEEKQEQQVATHTANRCFSFRRGQMHQKRSNIPIIIIIISLRDVETDSRKGTFH